MFISHLTRHIAILLTALFAVSLFPFNLLHHHEEEEHVAAMYMHTREHTCELDEHFCQDEFTHDCDHASHLSKPVAKCFSCHFHFIKAFDKSELLFLHIGETGTILPVHEVTSHLQESLQLLANKGPPAANA